MPNVVPFPIAFANLPDPADPIFRSLNATAGRALGRLQNVGLNLCGELAPLALDLAILLRSYPPEIVALRMGLRPEFVIAWAAETRCWTSPPET